MLGRFQPWHKGHTELFKKAVAKTGQVAIQIRSMPVSDKNPFDFETVSTNIIESLKEEDFYLNIDYIIMEVPNIVDISYGRDVGYTITKHDLGEEIHMISATKIREEMLKNNSKSL